MLWFKFIIADDRSENKTPSDNILLDKPISQLEISQATSILNGLNYSISGGSAMIHYINNRPTYDIDILISHSDLNEAARRYKDLGGILSRNTLGGFNIKLNNLDIDIFPQLDNLNEEESWVPKGLQDSSKFNNYNVLNKVWLIVSKLLAGREKDLLDSEKLFSKLSQDERKQLKGLIKHDYPQLMDHYESMFMLLKYSPNMLGKEK